MRTEKFRNQKLTAGFTLIETFAAIIILLIAILGPLTLLSRAITDGGYAKNQITASFLLQEGLDLVISRWNQVTKDNFDLSGTGFDSCSSSAHCYASIDNNGTASFQTFGVGGDAICLSLPAGQDALYQQTGSACPTDRATIFSRQIWFDDIAETSADELAVFGPQIGKVAHVQVVWSYKGITRTVTSTTILFK